IGNAEETKRWVIEQQVKTILLVTSNYHMPRSFYEFRHLVKGVTILPSPVPADDYDPATWWTTDRYRMLVFSEYHKYLFAVARHALLPAMREL
ncbi:MAG: YdcF family protein, partial [Rickettsiales bacterium]|nr:YdcF family protein [Rickettsiales bacterium]